MKLVLLYLFNPSNELVTKVLALKCATPHVLGMEKDGAQDTG